MRTQTTRIIAGRVNSDGSIATGYGFTVQRWASGGYTVTLAPGSRLQAATVAIAQQQAGIGVTAGSYTDRTFAVITFITGSQVQGDAAFTFTATVAA